MTTLFHALRDAARRSADQFVIADKLVEGGAVIPLGNHQFPGVPRIGIGEKERLRLPRPESVVAVPLIAGRRVVAHAEPQAVVLEEV